MIQRWSVGVADENMAEDILVDLAPMIRRHPWWHARAALTIHLLNQLGVKPPARILDAGCGWGVTLDRLERRGYLAVGMDISRRTLERLNRPGRILIEADLTKPIDRDVPLHDVVLALDVIEHIDDDREAVHRLGTLVRPGGLVIVSVPALPDLFTEFDAIQGHRRRYLPETLRAAFADTGLELVRVFWWGSWLVPALRRQRARPRRTPGRNRIPGLPSISRAPALAFALGRETGLRDRTGFCRQGFPTQRHFALRHRPPAHRRLNGGVTCWSQPS